MGMRHWRSGALAGALALVVGLTVVTPVAAAPRPTADYPSWDQVQAAKGDEAATAATVATIQTLLTGLQADAARLGDAAIARAAESDRVTSDLATATATAASLRTRADAAARDADRSAARASALVAALYRSGGTNISGTLLLTTEDTSSDLLYRLGALDKLGARFDLALQQAQSDRNQALALSNQATVARAERDRRATAAATAAASAAAASATADAAVAAQQAGLDQLYAQLAVLHNTSVQAEQQYQIGQQAANGGGSGGNGSSGGGSGGDTGAGVGDVPSGAVNDPDAARAYAYAILAQNGFGADQNSCLLWLWNRESGWRTNAYNASSGAYGIPQSLPGSKMASVGADWRTNYVTQVTWGLLYIFGRYGSPCGAWAHSESVGWY